MSGSPSRKHESPANGGSEIFLAGRAAANQRIAHGGVTSTKRGQPNLVALSWAVATNGHKTSNTSQLRQIRSC
jgi:hypothetical protein